MSTKFWNAETGINHITGKHWSDGYADNRHESCELAHGSFKEMADEYLLKVKNDPGEAESFVKKNRKKADFDKELAKKVEKLEDLMKKGGIIIPNNP